MQGLVIKDPFASYVVEGQKCWEMRSRDTSKRGWVAIIRKGSGVIIGAARLVRTLGPVTREQALTNQEKHRVSLKEIESGVLDKWNYAWVLVDAVKFDQPIPYEHPNGAVTWVNLAEDVRANIEKLLKHKKKPEVDEVVPVARVQVDGNIGAFVSAIRKVPVAKDGSVFTEDCKNGKGVYRVGDKGDEQVFHHYSEALSYLSRMQTAKWRRPNSKGNWGIVSAVEWVEVA